MESELKMILDTISGLGDTAIVGVAWYFAYKIIGIIICWIGVIASIAIITKTIMRIIPQACCMEALRDMIGIGSSGILTDYEKRDVMERVAELIRKEKRNEQIRNRVR